MQLELSQIKTDGGTQPRAAYHFGIVDSYTEDMEAGAVFPPVTVFYDGSDYWLADGFHRLLATKKLERATIDADIRQGTQQDAQWYSYSVNLAHGLRRSNEDKQRAVIAALAHPKAAEMSDEAIALHVGVDQKTVWNYRNPKPTRKQETKENPKSTGNGYRTGKDGVRRKTPKRQPTPAAPAREPEQDAEEDEPVSAPRDPIIKAVDDLVYRFSYDDLCRLIELLTERIAVNA